MFVVFMRLNCFFVRRLSPTKATLTPNSKKVHLHLRKTRLLWVFGVVEKNFVDSTKSRISFKIKGFRVLTRGEKDGIIKNRKGATFMQDYKRIIANNITELRKSVPLTQAELAERLNYSDKAVSKWERGESIPDVIVLKQIADMFGVTVDYLLQETHPHFETVQSVPWQKKKNHLIITALSCMLVFLIATLAFVLLGLTTDFSKIWLAYIYCVPVCAILLIIFNSIWGKAWRNYVFISILVWGILTSIYLTIGDYSNWLIFIIGVPGQIIIVIWSLFKAKFFVNLKFKKNKE